MRDVIVAASWIAMGVMFGTLASSKFNETMVYGFGAFLFLALVIVLKYQDWKDTVRL